MKDLNMIPTTSNAAIGDGKALIDPFGRSVPMAYVKPYDRMRDRQVNSIFKAAVKLRGTIEDFVLNSIVAVGKVTDLREKASERGNISVTSFDGLRRISIRQQYRIVFDSRVAHARDLMLGYINGVVAKVSGDDAVAIKALIDEAFRATPQGILSAGRVLALIKMDIKNADWREAVSILKDSLTPVAGKRYLVVEFKTDHNSDWESIRLDISDCWPEAKSVEEATK